MTIKMDADEKAGFDILREVLPEDLATDILKHRRRKKAHLTARVAGVLVREYKAFGNPEKAAEAHLMRAWTGFEASWVKNAQRFTDQNHPTPRLSANYGNAPPEPIPEVVSSDEMERRRQMVARLRQQGVLRA